MTKGQRAMAVAKIYPEPERGRGKKDSAKETEKVSYSQIKVARPALKYAPDLADNVSRKTFAGRRKAPPERGEMRLWR